MNDETKESSDSIPLVIVASNQPSTTHRPGRRFWIPRQPTESDSASGSAGDLSSSAGSAPASDGFATTAPNYGSDEDDDSVLEDAQPLETAPKKLKRPNFPGSKGSTKTRRSKLQDSEEEDSLSSHTRKPLGDVYLQQQKARRISNHPIATMPGKKPKGKGVWLSKKRKTRSSEEEEEAPEPEPQLAPPEDLTTKSLVESQRVLNLLEKDRSDYNARVRGHYARTNMDNMVLRIANKKCFALVKAVDEKTLKNATAWCRKRIKPEILEDLHPKIRKDAIACWEKRYCDFVRIGLNDRKNNIQQEMRKLLLLLFGEDPEAADDIPIDPDLILELVKREGLVKEKGGPNKEDLALRQAQFDLIVDLFMPKISGDTAWGKNHRHTTPMVNAMQPEERNLGMMQCVTESDLAYLHILFDNYHDQWQWEKLRIQKKLSVFPENYEIEEARGKMSHPDPKHPGNPKRPHIFHQPKPGTKWTNSEGGRCKFGGWSKKGLKVYLKVREELAGLYADKKEKARILKVDQECLQRLRIKHERDEVEARRAERKNGRRKVREPEESDLEDVLELDDSDEE